MPKFGPDITSLSPTQINPVITQGVQDQTAATQTKTLGDLFNVGVQLYKGSQLAELERGTEDVINEYMTRRPAGVAQLGIDTANLRQNIDTLWSNPDTTIEEINPIEKRYQETLAKYNKAVDQGTMSPEEFSTRTLATLRTAVNKNPGMFPELAQHANQVLELSGIQGFLKLDEQVAKQQAAQQDTVLKYYLEEAHKNNMTIPINSAGGVDLTMLIKKVDPILNEKSLLDGAERKVKFTADDFRDHGIGYANALINRTNDQILKVIKDPTMSVDKKTFFFNNALDNVIQQFNTDRRWGGILDQAPVKATQDYLQNQVNAIKKNLSSFTTGEAQTTYLKNQMENLRSDNYIQMSQLVNPDLLDSYSKLLNTVGMSSILYRSPQLATKMMHLNQALLQGLGSGIKEVYTSESDYAAVQTIKDLTSFAMDSIHIGKTPSEETITHLGNAIKGIDQDISKLSSFERNQFFGEYIKTLGATANKLAFSKLDDVSRQVAIQHVDSYSESVLQALNDVEKKYAAAGKQVTVGITNDGRIQLISKDPQVEQELAGRFTIRINDAISAYENLYGAATKTDAAKTYFNRFKPYFLGQK